jgi:hypothetical protein
MAKDRTERLNLMMARPEKTQPAPVQTVPCSRPEMVHRLAWPLAVEFVRQLVLLAWPLVQSSAVPLAGAAQKLALATA